MLQRKMTLFSLIFGGLSLLWVFHCSFLSQKVARRYEKLIKKQEIASSAKAIASTHQMREKVRKDIYIVQEDLSRLHYKIESLSSVLSILPGEKKAEVIETLYGIRCFMQDKLYNSEQPMQQLRFLEANEGIYNFHAHQFTAQTVGLSLFRLAGHELPVHCDPKTAFLTGIAKDVAFSFGDKAPKFQAEQFKASFKEGIP